MKFLTIRQPWASLIAVGAKTIETRGWSTSFRGPLAIHAGAFVPVEGEEYGTGWWWCRDAGDPCIVEQDRFRSYPAPLGAVVAVCDLVDVVPIVAGLWGRHGDRPGSWVANVGNGAGLYLRTRAHGNLTVTDRLITDQLPFGDFTPGRFAWLLDNVRPIDPVPMKGAQGLRDLPEGVVIP